MAIRTRGVNPSTSARTAAERFANAAHPVNWQSTLARWGLGAKGMLYTALGILAINVAAGDASSGSATQRGAIELVASQPFGQVLLVILTFGLFALAIWQLLLVFRGDPVEGSETKDRVKYAVKAAIYALIAVTALAVLRGGGAAGGGGNTEDQAAATIMSWPGGPWLVGVLGAAVLGLGLHQLHRHGMHRAFMARLDRSRMDPRVETGVERAGRLGYTARGIVFAITGSFFIVAAVQHDPQEAVGLSGALQMLAGQSWGQAVLWLVAVGLFLYGCFCFAEAKYRRAT